MEMVTLALFCLATARLSRIITSDQILNRPRRRIIIRLGHTHPLSYLITCDWCVSTYVGAGAAAAWWHWGDTRAFVAITAALAASHVAGFLASHTED